MVPIWERKYGISLKQPQFGHIEPEQVHISYTQPDLANTKVILHQGA